MDLSRELDLDFFRKNGFVRKRCKSCGSYFWTLDKKRDLCGDQPCVDFSFIGNPLTKRKYSIREMRKEFLSFFEKKGHTIINPYPVVARWRKDIYLTIASIADFQPHVTSGLSEPPANPLVISQPSIRLNDLDEVGVSGKHLTIFEMMGHHAFNSKDEYIYWTNETVRYCHEFLTDRLGIDEREITYKESIWEGGGNAGPCLEVLAGGLEVATLVFMNLSEDEKGSVEVEGKRYSEMNLKVVDTGYGLERLTWISQGTDTIYDVIYPEVIEHIREISRVDDYGPIYTLADHAKCLAFMLGDGIVPSNVKAGYLARLIIRRSIRFMKSLGIKDPLFTLVDIHIKRLRRDFPHLMKARRRIEEILDIEMRKYEETISRGSKLVDKLIRERNTLDRDVLVKLYDAHGIHPDMVKRIAEEKGIDVEIPKNFDSLIAEMHSRESKKEEKKKDVPKLPPTRALYYEDAYLRRFKARVLWSGYIDGRESVILDRTAFYPEGGGQPSDRGKLIIDGKEIDVHHVEKENGVIIHYIDGSLEKGEEIEGVIDWERRYSLMKHHTATHIINSACRRILGDHVWQAGSQLDVSEARFDFSHYKPLSETDIEKIEKVANEIVKEGIDVIKEFIDRSEAEKRYGVILYQGGVPEGRTIRVVRIPGIDVEACGGTHLDSTSEIGRIKIIKGDRIQDGVDRLIFVAGTENVEKVEKKNRDIFDSIVEKLENVFEIEQIEGDKSGILQKVAKMFSVSIDKLEDTIEKFIREIDITGKIETGGVESACKDLFTIWKKQRKEKKRISEDIIEKLLDSAEKIGEYRIIIARNRDDIQRYDSLTLAEEISKRGEKIILCIEDDKGLVFSASDDIDIDMREIARMAGRIIGGGGGGKKRLARCGGNKLENIDKAIEESKRMILSQLPTG